MKTSGATARKPRSQGYDEYECLPATSTPLVSGIKNILTDTFFKRKLNPKISCAHTAMLMQPVDHGKEYVVQVLVP